MALEANGQKLQPMTTELIHWVVCAMMVADVRGIYVILWDAFKAFHNFEKR